MKKPIIGITLDMEEPGGYSKFPWYAIRYNYLHSIEQFGGIPFPLMHQNKNISDLFEILDGLIITGGNFDIDPKIYGQNPNKELITKKNRTMFEISICKAFLNSSKPLLGICGGEQLINVVCGGNLLQDIKNFNSESLEHEQLNPRNEVSHEVNILKGSLLGKILNKNIINVNSAHHQAINKLGHNLIINGKASDGIIESIEHTKHPWCIGVQWHPEFLITKKDERLIKNFIKNSVDK